MPRLFDHTLGIRLVAGSRRKMSLVCLFAELQSSRPIKEAGDPRFLAVRKIDFHHARSGNFHVGFRAAHLFEFAFVKRFLVGTSALTEVVPWTRLTGKLIMRVLIFKHQLLKSAHGHFFNLRDSRNPGNVSFICVYVPDFCINPRWT